MNVTFMQKPKGILSLLFHVQVLRPQWAQLPLQDGDKGVDRRAFYSLNHFVVVSQGYYINLKLLYQHKAPFKRCNPP